MKVREREKERARPRETQGERERERKRERATGHPRVVTSVLTNDRSLKCQERRLAKTEVIQERFLMHLHVQAVYSFMGVVTCA